MPKGARAAIAIFRCGFAGNLRIASFCFVALLCLSAPRPAPAQTAAQTPSQNLTAPSDPFPAPVTQNLPANEFATTSVQDVPAKVKPPRDSQITIEGLKSYGNIQLFASGSDCKIDEVGIEYATHIWGSLFRSRVDYVAEVVPFILFNQPAEMDIWGTPETSNRKTLPGAAILPLGIRWMWRDGTVIKPYLVAKGGVIAFTQKAFNPQASYESMNLVSSAGVAVRLNERFDLRLGLVGYLHFSNGFIVPVNPGADFVNATIGLTYHLGSRRRAK